MANSKTKILVAYLSFILVLLSCNNNQQTNKAVSKLQQDLEEAQTKLAQEKASNEVKKLTEFQKNYEVFQPLGAFSTKENLLKLYIPVSSSQFKIEEIVSVSSPSVNAILVRVSDGSTAPAGSNIEDILVSEQKISNIPLDLTMLSDHQKLKVIVINSTQAIEKNELDALRKCIEKDGTDYLAKSCWDAIRKVLKPNSKNGDIIIGG